MIKGNVRDFQNLTKLKVFNIKENLSVSRSVNKNNSISKCITEKVENSKAKRIYQKYQRKI